MSLDKASKLDMIRTFSQLTVKGIVTGNYPSVGQLKREYGLEKTNNAMSIVFADLSQSFEGELIEEHIEEICTEVFSSSLVSLTLEDVYLCCRKIKMSKSFGKLSLNKIMKALDDYMSDRMKLAAEQSYNSHLSNKFVDTDRKANQEVEKAKFHEANLDYLKNRKTNPKPKMSNAKK